MFYILQPSKLGEVPLNLSGCKFLITFAMGFLDDYTPEELETCTLEELEILKEADYFFSQVDAYVIKHKKITLAAMERTNIFQEEDGENISLEIGRAHV